MSNHVKIGERLPSFSLPNQDGVIVNIDDIKRGKNLVLYFYPKNDTIVCIKEACTFRDNYSKFKDYNCEIVGISSDSAHSHQNFVIKHYLPFILLSDVENKVRKLLGVPRDFLGLLSGRYTYVIDSKGIIIAIINDHLNAIKHIEHSLKALAHEQRTDT